MPADIPFGNAFLVKTPALDQLGQRLYMEEKQRELQNQNNIKALDDEFSKNVSGIRDADVGDLTKAYQDYKTSTQQLMKQKDGVSPEQQLEVLRKKAAMYKLINESKAERANEELLGKRYTTKPDDFNDNAYQMMIDGRRLPISQKKAYVTKDENGQPTTVDLTNPENLLWRDKTNWQPILQKAAGTPMQRGTPVEKELPGGLETEVITYKGGNDPVEYYSSIMGSMNTPRASQSLATRYNFTPEEAQDITAKFEALKNTPEFKNAYGDVTFPASSDMSAGARTAKLLAMTNAINNPPVASAPIRKPNKSAVMDRQEAFKRAFQAQGFENAKVLARIRNTYSNMNYENRQKAINGDIDAFIDQQFANGEPVLYGAGQAKELKVSPLVIEAFKDPNTTYGPSKIVALPNGDIELVGNDHFETRKITRSEYKAALVNKVLNTNTKINQIAPKTEQQKSEQPKEKTTPASATNQEVRVPKDIKQTRMETKNKPMEVEQNGHRYRLNTKTGQYEPIR